MKINSSKNKKTFNIVNYVKQQLHTKICGVKTRIQFRICMLYRYMKQGGSSL